MRLECTKLETFGTSVKIFKYGIRKNELLSYNNARDVDIILNMDRLVVAEKVVDAQVDSHKCC